MNDSYELLCRGLAEIENVKFHRFDDFEYAKRGDSYVRCLDLEKLPQYQHSKNIFIRHDIDKDLETAVEMGEVEAKYGIRASYFMLYTGNKEMKKRFATKHERKQSFELLGVIQEQGHEVGLHYDFYGDYFVDGRDPIENAAQTLHMFRDAGLRIQGCAAHSWARVRKILTDEVKKQLPKEYGGKLPSFSIWKEFGYTPVDVTLNSRLLSVPCLSLHTHGLKYEAYESLKRHCYISDATRDDAIAFRVSAIGQTKHRDLGRAVDCIEPAASFDTGKAVKFLIHPHLWTGRVSNNRRFWQLKRF